jgi:hypothetical protein
MALILLAALAGAPTSAYTSLNLDNCEILTVAHAGEGDWSVRRCPGRSGISLIVNEDDSRFDVDAGVDNGQFESPQVISDLGPQVEWRSEGGRPFAIIYRYNIPEASAGNRSYLAVESIGRTGRPGCMVAMINGGPAGNARARQIADTRARTFRCGRDEMIGE